MRSFAFVLSLLTALQDPNILTLDVNLQQVVVTVRDPSGRMVRGLKREDFILEDNGISQSIVHFSDDSDAPISLGILIDATGSMGAMPGGMTSGVTAAAGITRVLLHNLKPDDEVLLMTFSNGFAVRQTFTKDRFRIEDAMAGVLAAGNMNVLSAITPALEQVRRSKYAKRALIVMSDAYFSGDVNQVASQIRRSEVPIFAFAMRGVDFGPQVRNCTAACHPFETLPARNIGNVANVGLPNQTRAFLDVLANESGGRSTIFELDPRNTMERINVQIKDIAADLRGQYLLGYYPKTPVGNRTLRVRTLIPQYRAYSRWDNQRLSR